MFNIALNTFKELKRNKILFLILFFGILLIIFSLFLASLSLGQTDKIVIDFGLSMIEIFGLISVVFIGSQILFKEIEGKTIYLILSKPISRYEFILGKFIGFAMILAIIITFQGLIFLALMLYSGTAISIIMLFSIMFIYLKLLVLFSIILFFSTFSSSILSIMLTIFIYIIAHSITSIIDIATASKNAVMINFGKVLYVVFPNFEAMNIKNIILSPVKVDMIFLFGNLVYGIIYLLLILLFSVLIFNRKTFENA
ncbi:MAG: ABC transporter permease [Candidatus Gracilibacteria bacterium]|nr:ABC transporter permease [Candidatus Gracilibacteria bacterium]